MTIQNTETRMSLDDCVIEVLGNLTGLELDYDPTYDRFYAVTRQINRALRYNALEHEWSWYADYADMGAAVEGDVSALLPSNLRLRQTGDDCIRFVDELDRVRMWAYFLPRDALHKYANRSGLWASVVRSEVQFSRPLPAVVDGWTIQAPVMREPIMFRLPPRPDDPNTPITDVPDAIRNQLLDFVYPDIVLMRAAYLYAQTDPLMQPRVQTLEAQYKDIMYQVIERDDRHTDSPYLNEFQVPISSGIADYVMHPAHPHSDERR